MKEETYEAKRNYLESFQQEVKAVKRIEEQIRELEANEMLPTAQSYSFCPHGSSAMHDLSDYIAKKDALVSKMLKARYNRIKLYTAIFEAIEKMEDEADREILTMKYIRGMNVDSIRLYMHYSKPQIYNMLNKAIEHFEIPEG